MTTQQNSGPLRLAGALEIAQAETVRQAWLTALAAQGSLVLDLGGVESCDAAGAQLLWAARKSALQGGGEIRFENVPPTVLDCWASLGLPADFFQPPIPGTPSSPQSPAPL